MTLDASADISFETVCDGCQRDIYQGDTVYCRRCHTTAPGEVDRLRDRLRWLSDDMREAGVSLRYVERLRELERELGVPA